MILKLMKNVIYLIFFLLNQFQAIQKSSLIEKEEFLIAKNEVLMTKWIPNYCLSTFYYSLEVLDH